jgi:hypothetical protein
MKFKDYYEEKLDEKDDPKNKLMKELEELVFKEIDKMFPLIEKQTMKLAKKHGLKRNTIPLNGFLGHLKKEARSYLPAFKDRFK